MELPSVETEIRAADRDVTYVIVAYRVVTRSEALMAIRAYQAQRRGKPAAGSSVRILTSLGALD